MSRNDEQSRPTSLYRYTHGVDNHISRSEPETVIAPVKPETDLEGHLKSVYTWSWDVNSNHLLAQQQSVRIGRSEPDTMPAPGVPPTDDGGHVKGPPHAEKQSKFAQIINCLFRKNTDVVDMKMEAAKSVANKQNLHVDRSERSRRVLKMESRKAAPKTRQMNGDARQTSPAGSRRRFLPSENPSAALMTYLGPQNRAIRRACSEQVRTSSAPMTNKPLAREAFNQSSRTLTRNTDYRGNRATEQLPNTAGKPASKLRPWETADNTSRPAIGGQLSTHNDGTSTLNGRKHKKQVAVVPGVLGAGDEMYNSDDEIRDLHDEMSRMNMSHPDMRMCADDRGSNGADSRKREGSISLSEGGESDVEGQSKKDDTLEANRIHRIPTAIGFNESETNDTDNNGGNNTMEQVIDDLYTHTQHRLDNIYQTGIESIASISQSATPDMDKFEAQYLNTHLVTDSQRDHTETDKVLIPNEPVIRNEMNGISVIEQANGTGVRNLKSNVPATQTDNSSVHMDSLLDDVSDYAKDRQSWLLDQPSLADERYGTESDICISAVMHANSDTTSSARQSHHRGDKTGRESTSTFNRSSIVDIDRMGAENPMMNGIGQSDNVQGRRVSGVRESTDQKCNKWVESNTDDAKTIGGILTGATLFRSVSRSGGERRMNMDNVHKINPESGNDAAYSTLPLHAPSKRTYRGVQIIDYADTTRNETPSERAAEHTERKDKGEIPWTKDVYNSTPRTVEDRLTINDSPSDYGGGVPYRARSPDSWISSCVSPTFMDKVGKKSNTEDQDTFDTESFGKSRPIIRQTPKIHVPFRGLDREATPMPSDSSYISVPKQSPRNQQLNTLIRSPARKEQKRSGSIGRGDNTTTNINRLNEMNSLDNLPSLPALRKDDVLTSMLDNNENETYNKGRPFSDIPIRPHASSIMTKGGYSTINPNSSNQNVNEGAYLMSHSRPSSEKSTPKRAESLRVGMGNIMATDKDRNRPMKQLSNPSDTQRLQYTQSFHGTDRNATSHSNPTVVDPRQKANVFDSALKAVVGNEDKLNRTSSIHSKHGLQTQVTGFPPIPQTMDLSSAKLSQGGVQNTADRFRKLRGRRDQEISWMMKDAAETEV